MYLRTPFSFLIVGISRAPNSAVYSRMYGLEFVSFPGIKGTFEITSTYPE